MSEGKLFVPLVTPLDDAQGICVASVRRLLHSCAPFADGYIPCLTSGEGWRLSDAQWQAMLGATLDLAGGKTVIAGIEAATTEQVVARAWLAERMGAHAVMFTSPFAPGLTQPQIIEHYRAVHAATSLPLMIYNESALSGNEKTVPTLLAIAALGRVTAIKDSPSVPRTAADIQALRSAGLAYLIGWEAQLAGALGSDGNVVSLANLEPAVCRLATVADQPRVAQWVACLDERFNLGADDWYAWVKRELKARGVLASDYLVKEEERP